MLGLSILRFSDLPTLQFSFLAEGNVIFSLYLFLKTTGLRTPSCREIGKCSYSSKVRRYLVSILVARAAVTKYFNVVILNNRNSLSHSSRCWKSELKVPVELVSSEDSERECIPCLFPNFWWFVGMFDIPWLEDICIALISAFMFTWYFLCVQVCVQMSPFYKHTSHVGVGGSPYCSTTLP